FPTRRSSDLVESFQRLKTYSFFPFVSISFILFVLFLALSDIGYFIKGEYGRGSAGVGSEVIQNYLQASIYSVIIINCINSTRRNLYYTNLKDYLKSYPTIFLLVTISYLIFVLMSGDRGPILKIVTIFFGAYVVINRVKYKWYRIGFMIFIAA